MNSSRSWPASTCRARRRWMWRCPPTPNAARCGPPEALAGVVPDDVDDAPAAIRVLAQLDRVDAAPFDVYIIGRAPRFIGAPHVRDIAEQVDAAAGFDLIEIVGCEEGRRVGRIFIEAHRPFHRAALL